MPKILIVEDSPTQAEALRLVLVEEGFEVAAASSGEAALEILAGDGAAPFDSIVSDVYMPGISGYELCKALNREPRLKEIPFILLTSRREPAEIISEIGRAACRARGCQEG